MSINSQPGRTFFTGQNIATTVMSYAGYNAQGVIGNGSENILDSAAWTNSKYDYTVIQVGVATLTRSGNVVFRVEGRFPNLSGRPASVLATTFSTAETRDRVFNISKKMTDIRIGVRATVGPASPMASPCNIYAGVIFSDIK